MTPVMLEEGPRNPRKQPTEGRAGHSLRLITILLRFYYDRVAKYVWGIWAQESMTENGLGPIPSQDYSGDVMQFMTISSSSET